MLSETRKRIIKKGTLARCDAAGEVSASRAHDKVVAPQGQRRGRSERASGALRQGARRERQRVRTRNAAPSGAHSAGQSASATIPAQLPLLPIVTRMGRDHGPGPRQRIEWVARKGSLVHIANSKPTA